MENQNELGKIMHMIETAEASLNAAKTMLNELAGGQIEHQKHEPIKITEDGKAYDSGENQIVEGTFDGQNMIGPEGKIYPVPANYASKSKLVEGDRLKLTILPNGSFLFKQISPTEREFVRGTLVKEDGNFKVIANGKSYKVLLASVTYYKGSVGDEITLIIPKDRQSMWGTIEAIIPQVQTGEFNREEAF